MHVNRGCNKGKLEKGNKDKLENNTYDGCDILEVIQHHSLRPSKGKGNKIEKSGKRWYSRRGEGAAIASESGIVSVYAISQLITPKTGSSCILST